MADHLTFDGERFTPENVREIWYEHMHRYVFATQFVNDLDVLDAACGEGYGSALLARTAGSVTGVDVSDEAIQHAAQRYEIENLEFRKADCTDLPFDDDRFDCIVSFETIEHLENQAEMLAEFRRVLKPDGFLVISSPDKAIYTDQQGFDNPHHVKELYREEFQALLDKQFPVSRIFGQKLMFHSAIWPLEDPSEPGATEARLHHHAQGGVSQVSRPVQDAMYLLAVCAGNEKAIPVPGHAVWLFDDEPESVYAHYQHEIRKNMQAGGILAERDQEIARLRKALNTEREHKPQRPSLLARLGLIRRR